MYFQRLEDLRIDADKTQEEIAAVLHCKREVYRRYEKGIHELPVCADRIGKVLPHNNGLYFRLERQKINSACGKILGAPKCLCVEGKTAKKEVLWDFLLR